MILGGLGYLVYRWPLITIISLEMLDVYFSAKSRDLMELRKRGQEYKNARDWILKDKINNDLLRTKIELIRMQDELQSLKKQHVITSKKRMI
jgi:hypothetical protein